MILECTRDAQCMVTGLGLISCSMYSHWTLLDTWTPLLLIGLTVSNPVHMDWTPRGLLDTSNVLTGQNPTRD